MTAVVFSASAFVIGGMFMGASGWSAILLAGAVPTAGLLWVMLFAVTHHNERYLPLDGYRPTPTPRPRQVDWDSDQPTSRAA